MDDAKKYGSIASNDWRGTKNRTWISGNPRTAKTSKADENASNDIALMEAAHRRHMFAEVVLKDTSDLKWKLYGKNVHFEIVQESITRIQAFVRGCLCRAWTSDLIESTIKDILTFREAEAKYADEDRKREGQRQKMQLNRNDDASRPTASANHNVEGIGSGSNGSYTLRTSSRRTGEVFKPWRPDGDESFLEIVLKQQVAADNTSEENIKPSVSTCTHVPPKAFSHIDVSRVGLRLQDRLRMWENASVAMKNRKIQQHRQLKHRGPDHVALTSIDRSGEASEVDTVNASCNSNQSTAAAETAVELSDHFETSVNCSIDALRSQKVASMRRLQPKPWASAGGSMDSPSTAQVADDNEAMTSDPILTHPSYMDKSTFSDPVDNSRGNRRYRTIAGGKNKARPWRDETDRFDAY